MRIRDVLAAKAVGSVVTIEPLASVHELLDVLAEHNIGAVVVSPDGVQVTGIVSERDVVRRIAAGPDALTATVDTIMSTDLAVCEPGDSLDDLMRLMTVRRIRHIPVMQDGRLYGLVSIGDAVKTRIGELEFERDQLNQYVSGGQ